MKKQCVYKLNNQGYLLVEHLITLVISSILTLTILSFLEVTQAYLSNPDTVSLSELQSLNTQLQIEAKSALSFSAPTSNELRIHKRNGDLITYFISNDRLMRQVNGKGGEVALYHCHNLLITSIGTHYATFELITSGEPMTLYLHTFNLPLPVSQLLEEVEPLQ